MIEGFADRLYEASVIHDFWPAVLRELASIAEARDAILIASNGPKLKWVGSSEHYESVCLEYYNYPSGHERTNRLFGLNIAGFAGDLNVFDEAEITRLTVYTELLIPSGYGSAIATAVKLPSGDTIMFNAERAYAEGKFAPEIVNRLDALRPHLARASILAFRLGDERARAATSALAALGLPSAVLDRQGRLVVCNELFAAMVPSTAQDRSDRLLITDRRADALFKTALEALANSRGGATFSVPVVALADSPATVLHLVPVKGAAHDIFQRGSVLLIATPVVPKDVPDANILQALFDLTPAEARVAQRLGNGATVAEIASSLAVSVETIRSQIKATLSKTGLHRQVELVGLLRGLAMPQQLEDRD